MSRALLLLVLVSAMRLAAEAVPVVSAAGPDRVVIKAFGVPVVLTLAHLDVPADAAAQKACQDKLQSLVGGKNGTLSYGDGFGTDASGSGKVHLSIAGTDVAQTLIENGLARFAAGDKANPSYDKLLTIAQERAQKGKKGVWAAGAAAPAAVAAAKPAKPAAPATTTASAAPQAPAAGAKPATKGAFASELNNKYYYPAGHRALANVNAQRLIYYADEAAAKKAGKIAPPAESASASLEPTEANADKIYEEGKEIYAQAIAAGNSDKRDVLYEQAFVKLSDAMNIYGALVEKDENNEALAEKLRACMQLRYGSVKQRRVH